MQKKHNLYKQYKIRYSYEKNFEQKYIIKIINLDSFLPKYLNKVNEKYFVKNNSISKTHNICRFTGRSKSVFNKYKMSRMVFRKYGENGYINGLKKSSW